RAHSSVTEPCPRTWPDIRITTCSHTASTSASRCVERISDLPNSRPNSSSRRNMASRPAGSRPLVGSSSKSTGGAGTRRLARLRPCFLPVRVPSHPPVARVFELEVGQHLVGPANRLLPRQSVQLARQGHVIDPAQSGDQGVRLRHEPDQPPQLVVALA